MNIYALFVSALLNLSYKNKFVSKFDAGREKVIYSFKNPISAFGYSIITLNYDMILEKFIKYINENYYKINNVAHVEIEKEFTIEKLHGCVSQKTIVAPTWNKNLNANILPAWKNAYSLVSKANHIRIIGYSLPETDTYIKYILKSAIIENEHLKTIDVLCSDTAGEIIERYRQFIIFPNFRFTNKKTEDYLMHHNNFYDNIRPLDAQQEFEVKIDQMEKSHENFFDLYKQ